MATTMQKVRSCSGFFQPRQLEQPWLGVRVVRRHAKYHPRKAQIVCAPPALSLRNAILDLLQRSRVVHRRQVTGVAAFTNRLDGAA